MPAFAARPACRSAWPHWPCLGAGIAALTRRPAWYGALRQVCLGAVAAGFTYAVGLVIGGSAPPDRPTPSSGPAPAH